MSLEWEDWGEASINLSTKNVGYVSESVSIRQIKSALGPERRCSLYGSNILLLSLTFCSNRSNVTIGLVLWLCTMGKGGIPTSLALIWPVCFACCSSSVPSSCGNGSDCILACLGMGEAENSPLCRYLWCFERRR